LPDWSVVNLTESRWRRVAGLGIGTRPEHPDLWEQVGITVEDETDDPDVAYAWIGDAETVPYGGWLER